MKIFKPLMKCLIAALLIGAVMACAGCSQINGTDKADIETIPELEQTPIGQPTKEYFPVNTIPRCIWDMEIFDNKLYIGNGDYDKNAGPVPMLCMSFDDIGEWEKMCFLSDEQIGRFRIIDGKLTIPGWDPCSWAKFGTYYQLENGAWKTHEGILDGLHNFDLLKFDGKLFASIGANVGETPFIVSKGGDEFERIPMLKDGKPANDGKGEVVRSNNLYTLGDKLYADFYYRDPLDNNSLRFEMYRYENDSFVFVCDLLEKLDFPAEGCRYKMPIMEKETLNDRVFLATGRLYYTDDMNNFKELSLSKDAEKFIGALDLYKYNDVLYILGYSHAADSEDYEISIFSIKGNNPNVKTECRFSSAMPPTSFAVNDESFFVALGNWSKECEENGTVIQLERE